MFFFQGPETDMTRVADLCKLSQKGYATSMVVTNHNKKVRPQVFASEPPSCVGGEAVVGPACGTLRGGLVLRGGADVFYPAGVAT